MLVTQTVSSVVWRTGSNCRCLATKRNSCWCKHMTAYSRCHRARRAEYYRDPPPLWPLSPLPSIIRFFALTQTTDKKKRIMQLRRRLPTLSHLRTTLTSILFLGLLPYIAEAFPLFPRQDINSNPIEVTSNHVCVRPAPWTQIFSFFLTNYIARIATFKKTSGYEGSRDYFRTIVSLFVPFFGISQAASTIARGSRFLGKDELGRALHAKTLCIVQRKQSWRPKNGDILRGCILEAPKRSKRRRNSSTRYISPLSNPHKSISNVLLEKRQSSESNNQTWMK